MISKHPDKTNFTRARRRGKRLNDYKVGISLGLIALITWLVGRNNSGGACLAGACMKAPLTQPGRFFASASDDLSAPEVARPFGERNGPERQATLSGGGLP